ncbi:MAG: hypothetical protein AMXMBFR64_21460 [Myxococcales bacterium]
MNKFHTPATALEAVRLRTELGDGAAFLAGGTEVNTQAQRPTHLISLSGLGLDGIDAGTRDVTIGACVRLQTLAESTEVPEPLRRAAGQLANRNIRNAATIGGHIGANNPWSDLLPTLLVLDARVVMVSSSGRADLGIEDVLCGHHPGLISHVRVPRSVERFAMASHRLVANDVPLVAVAVALERGGQRDPAVAASGVAETAIRLPWVEDALRGPEIDPDALELMVGKRLSPPEDLRGTSDFKQRIAGVLVARCVRELLGAGEGH